MILTTCTLLFRGRNGNKKGHKIALKQLLTLTKFCHLIMDTYIRCVFKFKHTLNQYQI